MPGEAPQLVMLGQMHTTGSSMETHNTQTMGGFLFAAASGMLLPFCAMVSLCAGSLSMAMVAFL